MQFHILQTLGFVYQPWFTFLLTWRHVVPNFVDSVWTAQQKKVDHAENQFFS